jgi:hypothetical protein
MDEISCAKLSTKRWKIPLGAEWPQADDYYDQERSTRCPVPSSSQFPRTSSSERASVAHEVGPCDDDDHGGEGGAFLA